jgi:hypothetical protein
MASIGIGAVKGVTGILGAFGQNNAEAEAARRQNEQLRRQYRYQLRIQQRDWIQRTGLYAQKRGVYQQTLQNNAAAASLAQGRNQQRINDVIKQQSVQTQNMMVRLAQSQGSAAASGRSGRSAGRIDSNVIGQYVRNQGVMGANLMSARLGQANADMDVRRRQENANNAAFSKVAIAPMKPVPIPEPVQFTGPSQGSLMAGVGNALLGGISAGFNADAQLRA